VLHSISWDYGVGDCGDCIIVLAYFLNPITPKSYLKWLNSTAKIIKKPCMISNILQGFL
jgi:hypothetical protein